MSGNPNILYFLSDQETYHPSIRNIPTPNQDLLRTNGISFDRCYCTTPQCTPSRSALLTGLYSHQNETEANIGAKHGKEIACQHPTVPNRLQSAGYTTAYIGKWHLGAFEKAKDLGFDEHWFLDEALQRGACNLDDGIITQATQWIRDQENNKPWFLMVSIENPHDIYRILEVRDYPIRDDVSLPDNLYDDLTTKPSPQKAFLLHDQGEPFKDANEKRWLQYRSYYYDLMERVDWNIGRLIQALDKKGIFQDTLMICTSDHGDMVGGHGLPYKGPFMYEELLNVPLIISYPNHIEKGLKVSAPVSHVNLAPTILEAAGVVPPYDLPGHSMLDEMSKSTDAFSTWGFDVFCEYLGKQGWINPIRTIIRDHWKLNVYLHEGIELYNLDTDPNELCNLADNSQYADKKAQLLNALNEWRRQSGDEGRWENQ